MTQRQITRVFSWLFPLVALVTGYLLVWKRGFYVDDYYHYALEVNFVSMTSNGGRFLSSLLLTGLPKLLADHEFGLRVLEAGLIGVNALLLG